MDRQKIKSFLYIKKVYLHYIKSMGDVLSIISDSWSFASKNKDTLLIFILIIICIVFLVKSRLLFGRDPGQELTTSITTARLAGQGKVY